MIATIAPLLEHDTAGDAVRGSRWTRKTTEQVAEQRKTLKIDMSPSTTERLWKDTGYSLRVNHKKVDPANKNPPPPEVRVWQFEHVNHMREKNRSCVGPQRRLSWRLKNCRRGPVISTVVDSPNHRRRMQRVCLTPRPAGEYVILNRLQFMAQSDMPRGGTLNYPNSSFCRFAEQASEQREERDLMLFVPLCLPQHYIARCFG